MKVHGKFSSGITPHFSRRPTTSSPNSQLKSDTTSPHRYVHQPDRFTDHQLLSQHSLNKMRRLGGRLQMLCYVARLTLTPTGRLPSTKPAPNQGHLTRTVEFTNLEPTALTTLTDLCLQPLPTPTTASPSPRPHPDQRPLPQARYRLPFYTPTGEPTSEI